MAAKFWFWLGRDPFWAHLAAIWGHGLLLSPTGAPGATEPQLHWPGLTPLLGPSGRHKGAWFSSIFNRGPGSNRASVALAWVGPPFWAHLAPWGASIVSIFPLSWPRGPRAMEPNLPLPGLIPLSLAFLGPTGPPAPAAQSTPPIFWLD